MYYILPRPDLSYETPKEPKSKDETKVPIPDDAASLAKIGIAPNYVSAAYINPCALNLIQDSTKALWAPTSDGVTWLSEPWMCLRFLQP